MADRPANGTDYDVLVIGAGAAGLMAAYELVLTGKRVAVVEATDRTGGRVWTTQDRAGGVVEQGAEFVHGHLPLTEQLAKKAGLRLIEATGTMWQNTNGRFEKQQEVVDDYSQLKRALKALEADQPVASFLEERLPGSAHAELRQSVQRYVEGYYAADARRASSLALYNELTKGDDENFRMAGGYTALLQWLERRCRDRGVAFLLRQPVQRLMWKPGVVEAVVPDRSFTAKAAVVTVSIGVLQSERFAIEPALPNKVAAWRQLGFGAVVKLNLRFREAFWLDERKNQPQLDDLSYLFSDEEIPTWWTQHPDRRPLLTGWLGGPRAAALAAEAKESLVVKALNSLSRLFYQPVPFLRGLLEDVCYHNWLADPFVCGAYSYAVVHGEALIRTAAEPVADTLFFAGEGLHHGKDIGTVEAAFGTGREAAQQLVAALHKRN